MIEIQYSEELLVSILTFLMKYGSLSLVFLIFISALDACDLPPTNNNFFGIFWNIIFFITVCFFVAILFFIVFTILSSYNIF